MLAEELRNAIQIAQATAKENSHDSFAPAHLLKGLLHNDVGLASVLAFMGKDIHYLRDWADIRIESLPKSARLVENPAGNDQIKAVMEVADLIRLQLSKDFTDAFCVLAAVLKPNLAFTADQLKTFPLSQKEVLDNVIAESAVNQAITPQKNTNSGSSEKNISAGGALHKYCVNKTELASQGKLDPIIGRDKEVRMIAEILGRRTKPNVILVGEPGVGKTALVDGFALHIIEKKVPPSLLSAQIFELDTGSLVAGASYKGEVEDRLKSIIKEIKQFEKAILFIDEIHVLLDSRGSVGAGVANLLKPELARGELTVIGATTQDEFRQFIEKDDAFSRRFEKLTVEEPDVNTAVRMLLHLLPFYEKHHSLTVQKDAVQEAVNLAKRYIKDRRLPDAAIDLLDRTMAAIKMMDEVSKTEIETLQNRLTEIVSSLPDEAELLSELRWFHKEVQNKVSYLLLNQLEDETQVSEIKASEMLKEYLENTLSGLLLLTENKKDSVERSDIAAMIAYKTGIPIGKVQSKEQDRLLNMNEVLKKRVVGQDHAVKALSDAVLEARSGLIKAGQPIGSFFLLGPTGTGKTELAKSLADFLFDDESFLIRFDMSEFKESHSVASLIGSPAGYVGYEEGSPLVNKIRQKPYSVVLFDEIEKAHPDVFDPFLQILDEGRLRDKLGKEGDFSNAVILFTSNIGSKFIIEKFAKSEIPTSQELTEQMAGHFRPEFLARLTEIVPFAPISEMNVVRIFEIHLKSLTELLAKQAITLEITTEAKTQLAMSGFTPEYGVRPLKNVIRNSLRRPISKMIIAGELKKGNTLMISKAENEELVWKVE